MSLAINNYKPTTDELEDEARILKRESIDFGPLHSLLVTRVRLRMLCTEYENLVADYGRFLESERKFDLASRRSASEGATKADQG